MDTKSRAFDHLTVQWTVQVDKHNVDVAIFFDSALVKKSTIRVNDMPLTWNGQIDLNKTSGYMSVCMIPSDNIVNLQIMFRNITPGQTPHVFTGQLDRWQV
jgi:hypothetical protein